jgi:hypothetical protein
MASSALFDVVVPSLNKSIPWCRGGSDRPFISRLRAQITLFATGSVGIGRLLDSGQVSSQLGVKPNFKERDPEWDRATPQKLWP